MINEINNIVNGIPALALIVGSGVFLTLRSRFFQFRRMGLSLKESIGGAFQKKDDKSSSMTSFQAVCTALSATVGIGNIAGVAGAIAIGGAGAVFWMWVSSLFGMCIKLCEITLAVKYRQKNSEGDYVGGPMYYIKSGLPKVWHFLSYAFCLCGIMATFFMGNITQVNTMAAAVRSSVNANLSNIPDTGRPELAVGIITGILVGLVLLGGVKRIGSVTEKAVPFMAIMYIMFCGGVLIVNRQALPSAFSSIIDGAFHPSAVTGGVIGSFLITIKTGVARGIFSNEAGLGTSAMAHASADTEDAVKKGLYGIFEVFADTIVICTATAFVILCSPVQIEYGKDVGSALTLKCFETAYGSNAVTIVAVMICFFAFSSIIGWGFYGTRFVEFLFGNKAVKPFLFIYCMLCVIGAVSQLELVWQLAELFNGIMIIPNLIAVMMLSPQAIKLIRNYDRTLKNNKKCGNISQSKS